MPLAGPGVVEADDRRADDAVMDQVVRDIARYVAGEIEGGAAYRSARYSLLDALACAALALGHDACRRLLGPEVPGTVVPDGARVPGTAFELAPTDAAFAIGCLIRWLDFNDTWLAAEWGHPSDNLGGILAVADHVSRRRAARGEAPLVMRDVLTAMIKAYEIQGVLSLANSFNRAGFDHVLLVRVATAAVAASLLGTGEAGIAAAVANAWLDGGSLRAYRHAPNVTWRKSWASADATSRGVRLAQLAGRGAAGCPTPLTAPTWGVSDVLLDGKPVVAAAAYGTATITNVIWKAQFPGEMHGQTAVECALALHPEARHRIDEIETILIRTQEPALRIIDKRGALHNPADRDHCLQYMVAVALVYGDLTTAHYEDAVASDPRIDVLRDRMTVTENVQFSQDYLAEDKRSVGNAVQVTFRDGSSLGPVTVEYPLGHPRRREEGVAAVVRKYEAAFRAVYPAGRYEEIVSLAADQDRLEQAPVHGFMAMLAAPGGTHGADGPARTASEGTAGSADGGLWDTGLGRGEIRST